MHRNVVHFHLISLISRIYYFIFSISFPTLANLSALFMFIFHIDNLLIFPGYLRPRCLVPIFLYHNCLLEKNNVMVSHFPSASFTINKLYEFNSSNFEAGALHISTGCQGCTDWNFPLIEIRSVMHFLNSSIRFTFRRRELLNPTLFYREHETKNVYGVLFLIIKNTVKFRVIYIDLQIN